jgi:hypothetical protein
MPGADFIGSLLGGLGAPDTPSNRQFLQAWIRAEGSRAANNPLATTKRGYAGERNFNRVGVKNYPDAATGVQATADTLRLKPYQPIISGLTAGNTDPRALGAAVAQSPWGTGRGIMRVLNAMVPAAQAGQPAAPIERGGQPGTMDVRLPNGKLIRGVPRGTTKAQLAAKLKSNGIEVPDAWMQTAPLTSPEMSKSYRQIQAEKPKGTDWGEIAAESLGGIAGAAVGIPGAAITGPAAPLTDIAAGALGAGAGRELYHGARRMLGYEKAQPLASQALEAGKTIASNLAGGAAGGVIARPVARLAGKFVGPVSDAVRRFGMARVTPTAGAVSKGELPRAIEKGLSTFPGAASVMAQAHERTLAEMRDAVQRVAGKFGTVQTRELMGGQLKGAVKGAAERFETRQEELYDKAYSLVGDDTPAALPNVKRLRAAMAARLERAPDALKPTVGKGLSEIDAVLKDAERASLEAWKLRLSQAGLNSQQLARATTLQRDLRFDALRDVRTRLGRRIKDARLTGSEGGINDELKQLYGALSEDMRSASQTAGPAAAKALATADRYTRMGHRTTFAPKSVVTRISNTETAEQAYQAAISGAKDGPSRLAMLRRTVKPEEWNDLAATVLSKMGEGTGGPFSFGKFITDWDKRFSPEAKSVLFNGTRHAHLRAELDNLVSVVRDVDKVERLANWSGTARHTALHSTIAALGAATTAALVGQPLPLAGMAAGLGAGNIAGRLMVNPSFVRWLSQVPDAAPGGLARHITRLSSIASQPGMAQPVQAFVNALGNVASQSRPSDTTTGQMSQPPRSPIARPE